MEGKEQIFNSKEPVKVARQDVFNVVRKKKKTGGKGKMKTGRASASKPQP